MSHFVKKCFLCSNDIKYSNYHTLFRLGKEGIVIPIGMKPKDVICKSCFEKEKDQYKGTTLYVSPMVKGYTEYNKALSVEDFNQITNAHKAHGLEMIDPDIPSFIDVSDNRQNALENEYRRILSPYEIREDDELGALFQQARMFAKSSRYHRRDFELDRLDLLLGNLKDIERHDKELYQKYIQKITNALTNGDFHGVRLEVITCATFIASKIDFKVVPESLITNTPDFGISMSNEVFVECASTHLKEAREGNLEFKIRRTIKEKSAKSYAQPNTALFLDATNIFYNSMVNDTSFDGNLQDTISKMLEDTSFGSVVIFRYIFVNDPNRRLLHGYNRFDNQSLDPQLKHFLDDNFPLNKLEIDKFFQPPSG